MAQLGRCMETMIEQRIKDLGRVAETSLGGCSCGACRGISAKIRDRMSQQNGYRQACLQGETDRYPSDYRMRE